MSRNPIDDFEVGGASADDDPDFEGFVGALTGQESHGSYTAKNKRTGAAGRWQILPSNWPNWAKEHLGNADAPRTPQNQDIVGRAQARRYWDEAKAKGADPLEYAALSWYTGKGHRTRRFNTRPAKGEPSPAEYVQQIRGRLGKAPTRHEGVPANPIDTFEVSGSGLQPQANPIDAFEVAAKPSVTTSNIQDSSGMNYPGDVLQLEGDAGQPDAVEAPRTGNVIQSPFAPAFEGMAGNAGNTLYNRAVDEHNAKIGEKTPGGIRKLVQAPAPGQEQEQATATEGEPIQPSSWQSPAPVITPEDTLQSVAEKGDKFIQKLGNITPEELAEGRRMGIIQPLVMSTTDKNGSLRQMTEAEFEAYKRHSAAKMDGRAIIDAPWIGATADSYKRQVAKYKAAKAAADPEGFARSEMLKTAHDAQLEVGRQIYNQQHGRAPIGAGEAAQMFFTGERNTNYGSPEEREAFAEQYAAKAEAATNTGNAVHSYVGATVQEDLPYLPESVKEPLTHGITSFLASLGKTANIAVSPFDNALLNHGIVRGDYDRMRDPDYVNASAAERKLKDARINASQPVGHIAADLLKIVLITRGVGALGAYAGLGDAGILAQAQKDGLLDEIGSITGNRLSGSVIGDNVLSGVKAGVSLAPQAVLEHPIDPNASIGANVESLGSDLAQRTASNAVNFGVLEGGGAAVAPLENALINKGAQAASSVLGAQGEAYLGGHGVLTPEETIAAAALPFAMPGHGKGEHEAGFARPETSIFGGGGTEPLSAIHAAIMQNPIAAAEDAHSVALRLREAAKLPAESRAAALDGLGVHPESTPAQIEAMAKVVDEVEKQARDAAANPDTSVARAQAGEGQAARNRAVAESALADAQAAHAQAQAAHAQALGEHAQAVAEQDALRDRAIQKGKNGGRFSAEDMAALHRGASAVNAKAEEAARHVELVKQAGERVKEAAKVQQEASKAQEKALSEGTRLREQASKRREQIAAEQEAAKEAKKNEQAKGKGVEPRAKAEPAPSREGAAKAQPKAEPAKVESDGKFTHIADPTQRIIAERHAEDLARVYPNESPELVNSMAEATSQAEVEISKKLGIKPGQLETKALKGTAGEKKNLGMALVKMAGKGYIAADGSGITTDPKLALHVGEDGKPVQDAKLGRPAQINGGFNRTTGRIELYDGASVGAAAHEFIHALTDHLPETDQHEIQGWANQIGERLRDSADSDDRSFANEIGIGKGWTPPAAGQWNEQTQEIFAHAFEAVHHTGKMPDGLSPRGKQVFTALRGAFTGAIDLPSKHVESDNPVAKWAASTFYAQRGEALAEKGKAPEAAKTPEAQAQRLENQEKPSTEPKSAGVDKSVQTPKPAPVNPRVEARKTELAETERFAGKPAADSPDKAKHVDTLLAAPAKVNEALSLTDLDPSRRSTKTITAVETAKAAFKSLHPQASDEQFNAWLASKIVTPEHSNAMADLLIAQQGGRGSTKRQARIQAKVAKKLGLDPNISQSLADANAEVARLEQIQNEGGQLFQRAADKAEEDEPALDKFLGKSVEREGMYTGTTGDFNEFRTGTAGAIYVSPNPDFASDYARRATRDGVSDAGGNVMKVYVRAENPFEYANKDHIRALFGQLKTQGIAEGEAGKLAMEASKGNWGTIESPRVQKAIKALGHDSFRVKENRQDNLGVYSPKQLKSATGNSGAYDARKADIRFERAKSDKPRGDLTKLIGQEKRDMAVALYYEGDEEGRRGSVRDVGERLGIGHSSVHNILVAAQKNRNQSQAQANADINYGDKRRGWGIPSLMKLSKVAGKGIIHAQSSYEAAFLYALEKDPKVVGIRRGETDPVKYRLVKDKGKDLVYKPDITVTYKDGSTKRFEVKGAWQAGDEKVAAKVKASGIPLIHESDIQAYLDHLGIEFDPKSAPEFGPSNEETRGRLAAARGIRRYAGLSEPKAGLLYSRMKSKEMPTVWNLDQIIEGEPRAEDEGHPDAAPSDDATAARLLKSLMALSGESDPSLALKEMHATDPQMADYIQQRIGDKLRQVDAPPSLLVAHNLKIPGIKAMVENGGIPVPSIAVFNAKKGFTEFGEITLLAQRDMVDPAANRYANRIFGTDIYSPRMPRPISAIVPEQQQAEVAKKYGIDKALEAFSKSAGNDPYNTGAVTLSDLLGGSDQSGYGSIEDIQDTLIQSPEIKLAYLHSKGEKFDVPKSPPPATMTDLNSPHFQSFIERFSDADKDLLHTVKAKLDKIVQDVLAHPTDYELAPDWLTPDEHERLSELYKRGIAKTAKDSKQLYAPMAQEAKSYYFGPIKDGYLDPNRIYGTETGTGKVKVFDHEGTALEFTKDKDAAEVLAAKIGKPLEMIRDPLKGRLLKPDYAGTFVDDALKILEGPRTVDYAKTRRMLADYFNENEEAGKGLVEYAGNIARESVTRRFRDSEGNYQDFTPENIQKHIESLGLRVSENGKGAMSMGINKLRAIAAPRFRALGEMKQADIEGRLEDADTFSGDKWPATSRSEFEKLKAGLKPFFGAGDRSYGDETALMQAMADYYRGGIKYKREQRMRAALEAHGYAAPKVDPNFKIELRESKVFERGDKWIVEKAETDGTPYEDEFTTEAEARKERLDTLAEKLRNGMRVQSAGDGQFKLVQQRAYIDEGITQGSEAEIERRIRYEAKILQHNKGLRVRENGAAFDVVSDHGRVVANAESAGLAQAEMEKILSGKATLPIADALRFADDLTKAPTGYFEGKLLKNVQLSDFRKAIVPRNTPADVREILKQHGLEVLEYNGSEERRQLQAEGAKDLMFQRARPQNAQQLQSQLAAAWARQQQLAGAVAQAHQQAQKATFLETLSGYLKSTMLSNPGTHGANMLANLLHATARNVADIPGSMYDVAGMHLLGTGMRTQTASPRALGKGMKTLLSFKKGTGMDHWDSGAWRNAWEEMTGQSTGLSGSYHRQAPVNWSNPIMKGMELHSKLIFGALGAEDAVFNTVETHRSTYNQALAQAKTEKAAGALPSGTDVNQRAAQIFANPSAEMVDLAQAEALVSTFQNSNALSTGLSDLKSKIKDIDYAGPLLHFAADQLVPFEKTLTNIIVEGLDMMGGGLLKAGADAAKIRQRIADGALNTAIGQEEVRRLQRHMAQKGGIGTLGTVAMVAMAMGAKGILQKRLDENAKDKTDNILSDIQGSGWTGGKIRVGGRWWDVRGVGPTGAVALAAAAAGDTYRATGMGSKAFGAAMGELWNQLMEHPTMKTMGQLNEIANSEGDDKVNQFEAGMVSRVIPFAGALNQVASMRDPLERKVPKDAGVLERVKKGIPGLREGLPARLDKLTGEPQANQRTPFAPFSPTQDRSQEPLVKTLRENRILPPAIKQRKGEDAATFDARNEATLKAWRGAILEATSQPEYQKLPAYSPKDEKRHLTDETEPKTRREFIEFWLKYESDWEEEIRDAWPTDEN